MTNAPGGKQVPIRPQLVPKLRKRWKDEMEARGEEETNKKLGGFINDLLERILNKYDYMQRYMPGYCYLGFNENVMMIKDNKKNKIMEIRMKNGRLQCDHCESDHCTHVMYAIALPDIARMPIQHNNNNDVGAAADDDGKDNKSKRALATAIMLS